MVKDMSLHQLPLLRNSIERPELLEQELAVAADPAALVSRLNELLTYGTLSTTSQNLIADAVNAVPLPSGDQTGALRQRVWIAVTLALCAPEFIVQK